MNYPTNQTTFDITSLQTTWLRFDEMAHLRPIHNEAEYEHMLGLMNTLLEATSDNEDHPLSGLLELVSELVSQYEQKHHAIPAAEPNEVLRFLMEQRGLSQSDLSPIVAQSNLSAILAGKRKISLQLAGKLASYFGVGVAVFVKSGS